jgi:hypothetical protein
MNIRSDVLNDSPETRDGPPATILIFGSGRSGSTILGQILGSLPGVFFAGELDKVLWGRRRTNTFCECRNASDTCPVWSAILENLREKYSQAQLDGAAEMTEKLFRARQFPQLLFPQLSTRHVRKQREGLVKIFADLHASIRSVTGCTTIVDGTKWPPYVLAVQDSLAKPLRCIYLTRDPRAVANSHSRRIVIPSIAQAPPEAELPRLSVERGAIAWNRDQFVALPIRFQTQCTQLRYEDMMAEPAPKLRWLCERLGIADASKLVSGRDIALTPGHSVGGNPIRLQDAKRRLELNEQWRTQLSSTQKFVVQVLTFPIRKLIGY